MAWRLDKSVVRGEIDNRVAGRVTGRIWLLNRPEPITLDLEGNCVYLEWFSNFNGRVVIEWSRIRSPRASTGCVATTAGSCTRSRTGPTRSP